MRSSSPWVLVVLMSGCASLPPARTQRVLLDADGLLVSNSPMFLVPVLPARAGEELTVTYSILVENEGRSRFSLLFDSASFTVKGRTGKTDCRVLGVRFPKLHVFPSDRYRVDCRLTLGRELMATLLQGDADGILKIGALGEQGEWTLTLEYQFRVEDAS